MVFHLHRLLREVWLLIPPTSFQTLVVALVLSWLDYGSNILVGLPAYFVCWLQSVLNESALVVIQLRCSDHITYAVASPHCCASQSASSIRLMCWSIKFFGSSRPSDSLGRCSLPAQHATFKLSTVGSSDLKRFAYTSQETENLFASPNVSWHGSLI